MYYMNVQEYIDWVNEHLPQNQAVDNISASLADGTLILKALSVSLFGANTCKPT